MDPNGNRILVQLVNTCFICRQMHVTSRDLNQHLHEVHGLPIWRYNRPEPIQIEMIPTEQYVYLNILAPNFDHIPQHAVFVVIRHACSLCHFHYPTLERLFRHIEAHFREHSQEDVNDEIDQLNQSFDFFDTHSAPPFRPNGEAAHQPQDAADAFWNEMRGGFQTNDGMAIEGGFCADDEASDSVAATQDSDQRNSGHASSGVGHQSILDGDGRGEEAIINDQQELGPQDMDDVEEGGFISNLVFNNSSDITLGPFIDGGNVNMNDQPLIGDIALREEIDQCIQDDDNVFRFVYLENP